MLLEPPVRHHMRYGLTGRTFKRKHGYPLTNFNVHRHISCHRPVYKIALSKRYRILFNSLFCMNHILFYHQHQHDLYAWQLRMCLGLSYEFIESFILRTLLVPPKLLFKFSLDFQLSILTIARWTKPFQMKILRQLWKTLSLVLRN